MTAFTYYLRVRYGECDAQKVVFNSRYGDYVDVAVNECFRAIGYGDQLMSGDLDFQLVKQTMEWKAPARFDDVLALSVSASRVGNTSFALVTEFRLAGPSTSLPSTSLPSTSLRAGALIATAETIYVLVDSKTLQKMTIPADLRSALERGAPDTVTDHAGFRSC